ncbi:MAG: SDR family NAD(P)-dependent oxidoreductase [Pseudomonadota bacterium]
MSAYTAAKHAVNGLTKSAAQEVGTSGVTINAICRGWSSPILSGRTAPTPPPWHQL